MKNITFDNFQVKRYRSLLDVSIKMSNTTPIVICGENNIGKTNFLRALNLFFNQRNGVNFSGSEDIPHHIYEGSQGAGAKTELIGTFTKEGIKSTVKVVFRDYSTSYYLNNKEGNYENIDPFLSSFEYLFIESHNVNLPQLIPNVLEKDGLLRLDSKRSKQSAPLEALQEFIKLSQVAIKDIESDINDCFKKLTDFDGILKDKQVKINFAEFGKLRDVVKTMTDITLYDGNDHSIALKGSGAQRALFLALMEYISQNSKKNIIWGVDEPEAFLQPKLQKKVAEVFSKTVLDKKIPIIITTHSPHFINLGNLKDTYLFKGNQEKRFYERKPNITFLK